MRRRTLFVASIVPPLKGMMYARMNTLALQSIVFIFHLPPLMIVTHEQDRLANHGFLLESRSHLWRRVRMDLAIPYFLLTYEVQDGEHWVHQCELYWQVDQLTGSFAELSQNKRYRFVQISLISPGWMNGKTGWQMETITEIWRTLSDSNGRPEARYVTFDGKLYTDCPNGAPSQPMVKILSVDSTGAQIAEEGA